MLGPVAKADVFEFDEKDVAKLVAKLEPKIASGFLKALRIARAAHDLDELTELLNSGQVRAALDQVARAGSLAIAATVNSALVSAAQEMAVAMTKALGVSVSFDQVNLRAVGRMEANKLRLVREFTNGQRAATREALLDGMRRGINPRETARVFRDSIGLTEKQQLWVQRYRTSLERGTADALTRQLRDRRFDSVVRRAVDGKEPLTPAQITRMVSRYRERAIKYRSEVIARTEGLRSAHEGNEEMVQQAIDEGTIRPSDTTRTWFSAGDNRVRDSHASLHGTSVAIGEAWITDAGNRIRFPGDPEAPASETIQCRCAVTTRIALPA